MTKPHGSHGKRVAKKTSKKATVSAYRQTRPPQNTRVIHSTPPSSATEIQQTLGIAKTDVKAALEAIESAL